MSHNPWKTRFAAWLVAFVAVLVIASAGARTARAQEDEKLHVSGEVDVYIEQYSTNFAGDYNGNTRGESFWGGGFSSGLSDTYSAIETRIREAELKFKKSTTVNESWKMVNEIEIELKPVNAGRKANDYDVEEASAIFQHGSGFHFDIGILEDKKLWEGGNTNESASEDAKGFDEQPSIRFGYTSGGLDIDVRYHSIFEEAAFKDSEGDSHSKIVNQTLTRLQVEYKQKDFVEALLSYTIVSSSNKEEAKFQKATADIEDAIDAGDLTAEDLDGFEAAGLDNATVLGVGGVLFLGNIWPSLTYESYHFEEDDGDFEFDVSVITAGVTLAKLGPGNLLIELELGSSDGFEVSDTGKHETVNTTQVSGEYHFYAGKSRFGPGFKYFSNDAEEKLKGTVVYFGGEWKF